MEACNRVTAYYAMHYAAERLAYVECLVIKRGNAIIGSDRRWTPRRHLDESEPNSLVDYLKDWAVKLSGQSGVHTCRCSVDIRSVECDPMGSLIEYAKNN